MLAGMKKYLLIISVSLCAVAFSYGIFHLLKADEVSTLDDLYELAHTHPGLALDKVSEIIEANPELMNRCHEITHQIGHVAYSSIKERAFDFVRPMCGAGYLHGLLEEAVTFEGTVSLKDTVHQVCKENQIESCLHGLGHAILNVTQNTYTAIDLCRSVTNEHTDCYDGVFMEQFDAESSPSRLTYEEALDVCHTVDPMFQPSCFFYLPRVSKDLPPEEVVAQCQSLISPVNSICAQGSGVMFMKYEKAFNKEKAISLCSKYETSTLNQHCNSGVENYSEFGSLENSRWQ
jgi:hypothetical protein